MPLTPDDVRNKRFTPVRLREGYDMGEVDQFLDEVEATLEAMQKENDELRAKLEAAQSGSRAPALETKPAPVVAPVIPTPAPEPPKPAAPVAPAAAPVRQPGTVAEASTAAARLLEIATKNADELVDDAKNQADRIIGEARTKAERLESEARTKAERVEADARTRSQKLDHETAERRNQLFGNLEKERDQLAREVDELRGFEREYRSRLKSYFESQLATLNGEEGPANEPTLSRSGGEQPGRLRSLLGEEG
ncbi:MAG: DivIVA domain-containing protein [Propionibacteriales bacterium]|nr:DivIVA domain-containing protein [Propionibacteriales bacterium]